MTAQKEVRAASGPLLLEQVVRRETLNQAWRRIRANGGSPGVDGVSIEQFPAWMAERRESVLRALGEGTYEPSAVLRVQIPKPDGGTRTLGVPTMLDRVIQQAIVIVLTPILDPTFSEASYGYRPGRSAHQAVRHARDFVAEGHRWVVDSDRAPPPRAGFVPRIPRCGFDLPYGPSAATDVTITPSGRV